MMLIYVLSTVKMEGHILFKQISVVQRAGRGQGQILDHFRHCWQHIVTNGCSVFPNTDCICYVTSNFPLFVLPSVL